MGRQVRPQQPITLRQTISPRVQLDNKNRLIAQLNVFTSSLAIANQLAASTDPFMAVAGQPDG